MKGGWSTQGPELASRSFLRRPCPADRQHDTVNHTQDEDDKADVAHRKIAHGHSLQRF